MSPHSLIHSSSFNKYWLSIYCVWGFVPYSSIQFTTVNKAKQVMFLPSWKAINGKWLNTQDYFSHPSINQARSCLASEIRRDRARSGWYGRRQDYFYMADAMKETNWWDNDWEVWVTLGRVDKKGFSKEARFELRFEDWEELRHAQ